MGSFYKPHIVTNRLRILRAERRWTQSEVAKRLKFKSKFRYWQIENEEAVPTAEEKGKLARLFHVPIDVIFPPSRAVLAARASVVA